MARPSFKDQDVLGLAQDSGQALILVLLVRGGLVTGSRDYFFAELPPDGDLLGAFVKQYYAEGRPLPDEMLLPLEIPDQRLLEMLLSEEKGAPLRLLVPQAGERLRLLDLATENARAALKRRRTPPEPVAALMDLKERLSLPQPPGRLECLDISTLQGEQPVGSLVAFVNGAPDKSGYRRFRIKGVAGQDDYAMLREVALRHYGKEGQVRPDLHRGGRRPGSVKRGPGGPERGRAERPDGGGPGQGGGAAGPGGAGPALSAAAARIRSFCRPTPRAGCCCSGCGTKPTALPLPIIVSGPGKKWWSRSWTGYPASARCGANGCGSILRISRRLKAATVEELAAIPGFNRQVAEKLKAGLTEGDGA